MAVFAQGLQIIDDLLLPVSQADTMLADSIAMDYANKYRRQPIEHMPEWRNQRRRQAEMHTAGNYGQTTKQRVGLH